MKKAVLTVIPFFIVIFNSKSQNVSIGASIDYAKSRVAAVAYSRPNAEYKVAYHDGKISEVILQVTSIYSYSMMRNLTYDKRYIILGDTVTAILDQYYNVSTSKLRSTAENNSLDCKIVSNDGKAWFVDKELELVSAVYLDKESGLATNELLNIASPLIPAEVKKQISKCLEKRDEIEVQRKQDEIMRKQQEEQLKREEIQQKVKSGHYFEEDEVQQSVKAIDRGKLRERLFLGLIETIESREMVLQTGSFMYDFTLLVDDKGVISRIDLNNHELTNTESISTYTPAIIIDTVCNSVTKERLSVEVTGERETYLVKVKRNGNIQWKELKGKYQSLTTNPALQKAIDKQLINKKGVSTIEGRTFTLSTLNNTHQMIIIDEVQQKRGYLVDVILYSAAIAGLALLL
jgi:hypothetical protein